MEITKKKKDGKKIVTTPDAKDIVYGEDEKTTPNRMIVFDDLMTDAFGNKDNESTMNLITTKLSHHNNLSVLIVCHELYPKGKSSVLFREQLTSVHLHAIANQQRIRRYVYGFLTDDIEKRQFDKLFNEHVLRVNDNGLNGNRRGSVFIHFMPGLCTDHEGSLRRVGRFLTFNDCGYSVVHETPQR